VLSQTIWAAEHYALLSHVADILAKILHWSTLLNDEQYQAFMKLCVMNSFFAAFTRILCHSILINSLDESFQFRAPPPPGGGGDDVPAEPDSGNDVDMVPFVPMRPNPSRSFFRFWHVTRQGQ
jgi:hypothetical protein